MLQGLEPDPSLSPIRDVNGPPNMDNFLLCTGFCRNIHSDRHLREAALNITRSRLTNVTDVQCTEAQEKIFPYGTLALLAWAFNAEESAL